MDIKLEIQSIIEVGKGMHECAVALTDVHKSLTSVAFDFWIGNGKNAFNPVYEDLKSCTTTCVERLDLSTEVIVNALQKYHEIEIEQFNTNNGLPADDIF